MAADRRSRENTCSTSPAPTSGRDTDVPSSRPTSIPDFDVAALAAASSSLRQTGVAFPLDLAIPVRTGDVPQGIDLRTAFLLLHVDGRSSLVEIAASAGLALAEVAASFEELVRSGSVVFDAGLPQGVPQSGTFPKELFDVKLRRRSGS